MVSTSPHKWIASTLILTILLVPIQDVSGAKILALMTTTSTSHHIWNRSLMLALAARGHQVTVLSPDPEKSPVPNHRDIVIDGSYDFAHDSFDYEQWSDESGFKQLDTIFDWGLAMSQHNLASKGAQTLMKSREKFDLIIVESTMEECFLGFVHHFGSPPVIAITAWSSPPWASYILHNPDNPSYIPNFLIPLTDRMSFYERMSNTAMHVYTMYNRNVVHMKRMDEVARKHFGDSVPSMSEIEKNISLILVNTHHSMDFPRPLVPAMIPVGGMHITPSKTLPEDIQKYLDEAKDGVIFFSLGSNLRSDKMNSNKITALLEAFKELPQRILWKWESDSLPGQPKNVKLGKWLPQNDILGHPNVRLFITHAGLLSTQEAIYHGVPIVAIPFMGDQHINIEKAIKKGVGERLVYSTLTKDDVLKTVRQVLTPRYRDNMKRLSEIFRDQPETPLDRAIFWTEYVIQHNGASHLRSAANDITWYQYLLLDVIAVLLLGAITSLIIIWLAIRTLMRLVFRNVIKVKQN